MVDLGACRFKRFPPASGWRGEAIRTDPLDVEHSGQVASPAVQWHIIVVNHAEIMFGIKSEKVLSIHLDLFPDDLVCVRSLEESRYLKPRDTLAFQHLLDHAGIRLKDPLVCDDLFEYLNADMPGPGLPKEEFRPWVLGL